MFKNNNRIVLTLDAGGTNFVFSAIQNNTEIVTPLVLPAYPDNLKKCLDSLVVGFSQIKKRVKSAPVAISFAFPGPADYENGIIGDLPNFPSFKGGVALGPFLREKFDIPVFINNDGNLFAYGEALCGILPEINKQLEIRGNRKRYKNLLGFTFGTGFGGGVVINNDLLLGDNGCGGDVWSMVNKTNNNLIAEEGVSIRAIQRKYHELSGTNEKLTPKEIYDIAEGNAPGNRSAAIKSFEELGEVAGFTIAESLSIVDGIVVIGGGIANAYKYFMPSLVKEMNGFRYTRNGEPYPRLSMKVYNLLDEQEKSEFFKEEIKTVKVPEFNKTVGYNVAKKTGITTTKLGTSRAIALGAYNFALNRIDKGID